MLKAIQKISLALVAVLICANSFGQMKQKVADRLYDELVYYKAAELYADLADKNKATDYQVRRAAECYRLIGNTVESERWYAKLVNMSGATAEDNYYYAQMLKGNEKYSEANEQMEKFYQKKSNNTIAKAHVDAKNYVQVLEENKARFEIKNLGKTINTRQDEFSPSYYHGADAEKIYFASNRRGRGLLNVKSAWAGQKFTDIYAANVTSDRFIEKPEKVNKKLNSKFHEGPVAFSNKGTVMYLTRSNYINKEETRSKEEHNNLQLYIAKKNSEGEWGELEPFNYNSKEFSTGHATVSEDGMTMYFVSDMQTPRGGNGNKSKGAQDIWKTVKKPNGKWGVPENVKDVNTEGAELFPYLSPNGILYFSSTGHLGLGGLDLYRAEPTGEGFSVMNMGAPLNTNKDDFAFIANKEETAGYFSSNREAEDAIGGDDIYGVKILYPFGPKKYNVKGLVTDAKTGGILSGAKVNLLDAKGVVIGNTTTDENGLYEFKGFEEGSYKVVTTKEKFAGSDELSFSTESANGKLIDNAPMKLKKAECGLIGSITEQGSGKAMSGVKVSAVNNLTGEVINYDTDENGVFKDNLEGVQCPGGTIDYTFTLSKEGYFPKDINFKKTIDKEGVINLNDFLKGKVVITKKAEGVDVKDLCDIEDILFDLGKATIRPDAAAELDKLVACMKKFPEMKVEIGSHTDCRGSARFNRRLSDKRAKSSMKYVIKKGISSRRIFGKGYGESKLTNDCACEKRVKSDCDEEQHAVNRRTEFIIVGLDK